MSQLYLLRHGLAVAPGTPGIEDDDRPLTPEGERRARQVGRALSKLRLKLDKIVTSPLPRAYRTAEIVAKSLEKSDRLEVADELRSGNDAASIETWLATRTEERLMLVGHNMAISDLISRLVVGFDHPGICELRKGGVAALRNEQGGRYQIDWIARPKLFRI